MFRERFKEDGDLFGNLDVEIPIALPSGEEPIKKPEVPKPRPQRQRARREPVMKPSVGVSPVSGVSHARGVSSVSGASPVSGASLASSTGSASSAGTNNKTANTASCPSAKASANAAPARAVRTGTVSAAGQTVHRTVPQTSAGAVADASEPKFVRHTASDRQNGASGSRAAASPARITVPAASAEKKPEKITAPRSDKKSGRRVGKIVLRAVFRTLLVIVLLAALGVASLIMILNEVFNGPSETARNVLTMSLIEASATKWIPAKFIGEETVEEIRKKEAAALPVEKSDPTIIKIQDGSIPGGENDRFAGHPDGIVIEKISGDTFNAYVMLIKDPSSIYLASSSPRYSKSLPGTRINRQIELEGAIAAINGGAFFDDGSASSIVGSVPCGLVISKGRVLWDDGDSYDGFVGFNEDNVMVVAKTMSSAEAKELKIRDGCCFGPVLVMNGEVNEEAYNTTSGYNPRTAVGQCADGTVIFLCVDGRQTGSLGATNADIIDIFVHYGAVNACNLDGGSSTVMLYRDTQGLYGEAGKVQMINNYSLLQAEPRRMPTFFMVRPKGEA